MKIIGANTLESRYVFSLVIVHRLEVFSMLMLLLLYISARKLSKYLCRNVKCMSHTMLLLHEDDETVIFLCGCGKWELLGCFDFGILSLVGCAICCDSVTLFEILVYITFVMDFSHSIFIILRTKNWSDI